MRDRQDAFGQVWRDAMRLALAIEGVRTDEPAIVWETPAFRRESTTI